VKLLTVMMVVVLLLVLCVATYAQGANAGGPAPGAQNDGEGRGFNRGDNAGQRAQGLANAFRAMRARAQTPPPVAMIFEGFIFVILGNVIYKVDPQEMKVVGAAFLMPPGVVTAGPAVATPLAPAPGG